MLQGIQPEVALGRDSTILREILDRMEKRLGSELQSQPEVEADLRHTLGLAYLAVVEPLQALRQAILDANSTEEPDLIQFNVAGVGVGVQTIAPSSPLPAISHPVTIDGYSQPGASPNTFSIDPGEFAQATTPALTAGSYHMPGTFLRGDQTAEPVENRPGVLLYSGFGKPGDPRYVERYGTLDYQTNGADNYAGLNFRIAGTPVQGKSKLARQPVGPYPLRASSKYYVRYGGVSGVHEPQPNSITALQLYGYNFTFSSFGVSYLDNGVRESRINGSVKVPDPSDFTQSFAGLTLTCNGALESAEIPPTNSVLQPLKYWESKFRPLAMDFARTNSCNPSNRFLVLGRRRKP